MWVLMKVTTETEVIGATFENFEGRYCNINVFCLCLQNG